MEEKAKTSSKASTVGEDKQASNSGTRVVISAAAMVHSFERYFRVRFSIGECKVFHGNIEPQEEYIAGHDTTPFD